MRHGRYIGIDHVYTCICGYAVFSLIRTYEIRMLLTNGVDDVDDTSS